MTDNEDENTVKPLFNPNLDWSRLVDEIFSHDKVIKLVVNVKISEDIMSDKLGIMVGSDKHLDSVINLTDAAYAKGKTIEIFFTGYGVYLTQRPEFEQLVGKAKLSVCDVSFRAYGLTGDVPGVGFKDFATQARNAEMMNKCDRFITF